MSVAQPATQTSGADAASRRARAFRLTPTDTEGHLLYELANRQWNIPRLIAQQLVLQPPPLITVSIIGSCAGFTK
jgi:hypothetical protein